MRVSQCWTGLLVMGVVAVLQGCGGHEREVPETLATVSGKVLVDNQPVAGISMQFVPAPGTAGTGGYAVTDAEGKYSVKHNSGADGVEPGEYKVVLSHMAMPDGSPVPPDQSAADVGAVESLAAQYTTIERTPLTATVPKEGKTDLDFMISKK